MMYQNKMALAIKVNGQVLRENGETVQLPFGCEYSIMLKNLNSVRAAVKVWVDGVEVTAGTAGIVVPANQSVDLERSIVNGNLTSGNRFKFIEKTAAVSAHRGNRIDDGLVRIEFTYEKPRQVYQNLNTFYRGPMFGGTPTPYYGDPHFGFTASDMNIGQATAQNINTQLGGSDVSSGRAHGLLRSRSTSFNSLTKGGSADNTTLSSTAACADGITVPGSVSSQQFSSTSFDTDGVSQSMVLKLIGEVKGIQVAAPITVKTKPVCSSCGKVNKANAKFCTECGTGLQIV